MNVNTDSWHFKMVSLIASEPPKTTPRYLMTLIASCMCSASFVILACLCVASLSIACYLTSEALITVGLGDTSMVTLRLTAIAGCIAASVVASIGLNQLMNVLRFDNLDCGSVTYK